MKDQMKIKLQITSPIVKSQFKRIDDEVVIDVDQAPVSTRQSELANKL